MKAGLNTATVPRLALCAQQNTRPDAGDLNISPEQWAIPLLHCLKQELCSLAVVHVVSQDSRTCEVVCWCGQLTNLSRPGQTVSKYLVQWPEAKVYHHVQHGVMFKWV